MKLMLYLRYSTSSEYVHGILEMMQTRGPCLFMLLRLPSEKRSSARGKAESGGLMMRLERMRGRKAILGLERR